MERQGRDFKIGDRLCVLLQQFPIVFTVRQITTDAHGKIYYSGDGEGLMAQKWWGEDQLDYFLTEDEELVRRQAEQVLHDTEAMMSQLREAGNNFPDSMPKHVKDWFYRELGRILGWEADLK